MSQEKTFQSTPAARRETPFLQGLFFATATMDKVHFRRLFCTVVYFCRKKRNKKGPSFSPSFLSREQALSRISRFFSFFSLLVSGSRLKGSKKCTEEEEEEEEEKSVIAPICQRQRRKGWRKIRSSVSLTL